MNAEEITEAYFDGVTQGIQSVLDVLGFEYDEDKLKDSTAFLIELESKYENSCLGMVI